MGISRSLVKHNKISPKCSKILAEFSKSCFRNVRKGVISLQDAVACYGGILKEGTVRVCVHPCEDSTQPPSGHTSFSGPGVHGEGLCRRLHFDAPSLALDMIGSGVGCGLPKRPQTWIWNGLVMKSDRNSWIHCQTAILHDSVFHAFHTHVLQRDANVLCTVVRSPGMDIILPQLFWWGWGWG